MKNTSILWTNHTWNIFRARDKATGKPGWMCIKMNEGCRKCYAEALNMRFGNRLPYNVKSLDQVEFYMAHERDPYKYEEPALVFVHSMTDTFMKEIPDAFRHKLFDIIEENPQHEFQILTKRVDLMLEWSLKRKFPPNAWAGVTVPHEKYLTHIEILKNIDAEVRWVSMEPLLSYMPHVDLSGIHWVITGGESGSHMWDPIEQERNGLVTYAKDGKKWTPKPDAIQWIHNIKENCRQYGTAFFHKQWGGALPGSAGREVDGMTYNEFPRLPKK